MIEGQPKAPRMMEEKQRKNDREGYPYSELLVGRYVREGIENKKTG